MKNFSIKKAYRNSWSIFKNRPWFFLGIISVGILATLILTIPEIIFEGVLAVEITTALLNTIISTLITIGVMRISLKAVRHQKPSWQDFYMNSRMFFMFLLVGAVTGLLVFLGLIALVVPGIILAIMWTYALFLLIDYPKATTKQLLRASARITKGSRWKILGLAFVNTGVALLGLLALVVGILPASIVIMLASTFIYNELKNQTDLSDIFPKQ